MRVPDQSGDSGSTPDLRSKNYYREEVLKIVGVILWNVGIAVFTLGAVTLIMYLTQDHRLLP